MTTDKKSIFILSFFIFFIKWVFIFYFDIDIDFITKIIFNLNDRQYFTLIYNLSNLNFNPTYDPNLLNSNLIGLPIYSILFHSLFFKLFNIYGFVIIELFIIIFFFYILFSFFNKLGINRIENIFLSLLIFCLPNLIDFFEFYKFPYIASIKELYNLRIPRPSISHLYLFIFFFLLILHDGKNIFKYRHLALVGMIFAFMWGSYYYNLASSVVAFSIYYFYIKKSSKKITDYLKDGIVVCISFFIFSVPVIYILLNSEPNYLMRVGLIELDLEKKKILLNHLLNKIFSLNFIVIFFLITFFNYFLRKANIFRTHSINLLYFIFLGSFLGPFIFIIISPTISEPYHFFNMLIALTFFVLLTYFFLILLTFLQNKQFLNYLFKTLITLLLFFYIFYNYSHSKKNLSEVKKIDTHELMSEIKKFNINKKNSILTFDDDVQTNLILNNYTNLNFVIGINTSLNDETLENNLMGIFKFLGVNQSDFNNFIKNEKKGWRFLNNNIGKTFYMKYQANKLITYNNSIDFSSEELKFILNSSPLHSQQLIIPAFEVKRLNDKFTSFIDQKKIKPDLIIVNLKDKYTENLVIDNKIYCLKNINETFRIYYNPNINSTCLP